MYSYIRVLPDAQGWMYMLMLPYPWHTPASVCVCVSLLAAQYVDSPSHTHMRAHVYTATSFSSDCSPSGRAPRIPGRRAPVRGLPSSARQPGTSPCFLYGSRTQRCPLRRAPPPRESWETDGEKDRQRVRPEASAFVQKLKINRARTLRRSISGSVLGTSHRGAVTGPESIACLINVCLRRDLTGVRQGQRLGYDKHFTTALT